MFIPINPMNPMIVLNPFQNTKTAPQCPASAPGPLRRVCRVVGHGGDFGLQLLLHRGGRFQNQRHQNVQHHQVGDHKEGDLSE